MTGTDTTSLDGLKAMLEENGVECSFAEVEGTFYANGDPVYVSRSKALAIRCYGGVRAKVLCDGSGAFEALIDVPAGVAKAYAWSLDAEEVLRCIAGVRTTSKWPPRWRPLGRKPRGVTFCKDCAHCVGHVSEDRSRIDLLCSRPGLSPYVPVRQYDYCSWAVEDIPQGSGADE